MITVHVFSGSKYQCKYCGKDFLSMPNMKKHVRFHLGYRATCRECNGTFTNVGSLRKHTRVAHPEVFRAKLVERLEKFGVLRGPDKNALKKKIVDKVISRRTKKAKATNEVVDSGEEPQVKKEFKETSDTQEKGEFHAENDINFAADEIDDGGSRFKFSCTVCKKRFSSYLNMCRHRRKAHGNENKPRSEHCLTYGHQSKAPSPISENPEEIALFYAGVSHNIATNLNCYIDGKPESLTNFASHIKIEGYSGTFGYTEGEVNVTDFNWEYYNFPSNFCPCKTIGFGDIKSKADNSCDPHRGLVDLQTDSASGISSVARESAIQPVETKHSSNISDKLLIENKESLCSKTPGDNSSEENSDQNNTDKGENSEEKKKEHTSKQEAMGIASGMKMLSTLMQGRIPDNHQVGKEDKVKFIQVRIADGVIQNTESPAARTFHQVCSKYYAG